MRSDDVLVYLHQICRGIDEGTAVQPFVRRSVGTLALPAAIALSGLSGGCYLFDMWSADEYGAPFEPPTAEVCDDGVDNDANGMTDCQDAQCATHPACRDQVIPPTETAYGAPFPEDMNPIPPPIPAPVPDPVPPVPQLQQPQPPPPPDPGPMVPAYGMPFPPGQPEATPPEPAPPPAQEELTPPVGAYGAPFPRDLPPPR